MPVLYLAGFGRSGSTLLDRLVGGHAGVVGMGELSNLWLRGVLENQLCSCGQRFASCPFWSKVRETDPSIFSVETARVMVELENRLLRTRRVPALWTARSRDRLAALWSPAARHAMSHLYRAIQRVSGAQLIVDSSKHPTYGFLLAQSPEVRMRIVHLIRDPRAVAFSWLRPRRDPTDVGLMTNRYSATQSALIWDAWNVSVPLVAKASGVPYARLRYEDLVENAHEMVEGLIDDARAALGLSESTQPVVPDAYHSISGNPMRFHPWPIEVRLDNEWRRSLPPKLRRTVSVLTLLPLGPASVARQTPSGT